MPHFLRRTLVLLEARRALARGAPERAVSILRDPAVQGTRAAGELRERALEGLYQTVQQRAEEGREASFFRLLEVVAQEDPGKADSWRRELGRGGGSSSRLGAATALPEDVGPVQGGLDESPSALEALLHHLRSREAADPKPPRPELPLTPRPVSLRFHLAVDDGGDFLVVSGTEVTLGHARTGHSDIPFLADLESLQASIARQESFHAGAAWVLTPLAAPAWVDGREVGSGASRELLDGDIVRLSPRVEFAFRLPEAASSSALLELLHGAEADGATRVLLLVPGPGGRIRIGPRLRRHVPVADLEHEVTLTLEGEALGIQCEGGVRIEEVGRNPETASTNKSVPCPPPSRIDLTVNARPSRRPPFGLSLRPVEGPSDGHSLPGTGPGTYA